MIDTNKELRHSIEYFLKYDKPLPCKQQLELDDALHEKLDASNNKNQKIILRLWESSDYCIVLGRSNKKSIEVNTEYCNEHKITVHSRSSGGGTVILGPGCLCYSLFIPTTFEPCNTIQKTNCYIMKKNKAALETLINNVRIQGYTDLCVNEIKFSGNAQRRKKNSTLFHGTFLYDFDLDLISKALAHPSKEPDYRKQRTHKDFISNIKVSKKNIIQALNAEYRDLL